MDFAWPAQNQLNRSILRLHFFQLGYLVCKCPYSNMCLICPVYPIFYVPNMSLIAGTINNITFSIYILRSFCLKVLFYGLTDSVFNADICSHLDYKRSHVGHLLETFLYTHTEHCPVLYSTLCLNSCHPLLLRC